jgi:hypothetical protein
MAAETLPAAAGSTIDDDELYGLVAEFEHPEELVRATQAAYAAGYRRMDAYTPIPVEGLTEALGRIPTKLPLVVLLGAILGGAGGYFMQWFASVVHYPMNVGGRPHHSWPAFLPIVFELSILGAALFAVLGMLALNDLPQPYHPLFNLPQFRLASRDRFFLCLEARDPKFRRDEARAFLQSLTKRTVLEAPK